MRTMLTTSLALLLAAVCPAAAAETAGTPPESPEVDVVAPSPAASDPANSEPAPTSSNPTVASAPQPAAPEPPALGWRHGKRAPVYVGVMLLGEGFVEDTHRRLTTRKTPTLEGIGGLLRAGAVLDLHNRVGVRMQSFFRPTKRVIRDQTSVVESGTNDWGSVEFGYIGPEYLYITDAGIYVAGSLGVGGVMSQSSMDPGDDCTDCRVHRHHDTDIERGSVGGGAMASVGYEWRSSKWLALHLEAFGGVYHGLDDNERVMNNALFGLGMGLGF